MEIQSRTIKEIFESHINTGSSVLIHPGLTYNFLEVTPEFHQRLKNDIQRKIMMIKADMEEPDAILQFAMMMLENSY